MFASSAELLRSGQAAVGSVGHRRSRRGYHAGMSYVALLRAVNVGGTKLPMADLRALLEGLGLTNVRTYLQSGNAVFDAGDDAEPAAALATAIEMRIERDLGPRVGVLVLPGETMADVAAANPFSSAAPEGAGERATSSSCTPPSSSAPTARRTSARRPRRPTARCTRPPSEARAAGRRGRGGGVRRRAAARHAGRLPQAAARVRAHQAEQRLVRAQARHGRHHAELADGAGARRHGRRRRLRASPPAPPSDSAGAGRSRLAGAAGRSGRALFVCHRREPLDLGDARPRRPRPRGCRTRGRPCRRRRTAAAGCAPARSPR